MADCGVAATPETVLVTYALGSCLGLAVYDSTARVGGLLHFMLPDSAMHPARSCQNPSMFADTGIALLLERVRSHGGSCRHLTVCAVGAARILDEQGVFEIGKQNYQAARRLLSKHGLPLACEAVGGMTFRTLSLEIATGRVLVNEAGRKLELELGKRKTGRQS
jgi:chemotaxis protein CheD